MSGKNHPSAEALLSLSHRLGMESRKLAILGEGNTSARLGDGKFLVKASGSRLATLGAADIVECHAQPLLELLDAESPGDSQVDEALLASRTDSRAKKPSVEALFHAWLLTLPEVRFVGHAHPVHANSILCSPRAAEFADQCLFPDQIVCCGPRAVLLPYTDPGLRLAKAIREAVREFIGAEQTHPRVILLANHGVITMGPSIESVEAAMLMCDKAAEIFIAAATLGGSVFLPRADVGRIGQRPDEHHRRKVLGL